MLTYDWGRALNGLRRPQAYPTRLPRSYKIYAFSQSSCGESTPKEPPYCIILGSGAKMTEKEVYFFI